MIYLGSHVSMKSPSFLLGSLQDTISFGANACMIYTGPPSNSRRRPIEDLKVKDAHVYMQAHDFDPKRIIVHAPYIINLANTINPEKTEFGIEFLVQELSRVEAIGAQTLVLHPGSHVKAGLDIGITTIVNSLNTVFEQDTSDVNIALETMAGKGSECGFTLEQLAQIKQGVIHSERIHICMDTCHMHDAGYDLEQFDSILDTFKHLFGLEYLAVMHINDSKNEMGARKDRHENIGNGYIGFDTLHAIVQHSDLQDVTKILETPYIDGKPPYKEEIKRLRETL